MSCACCHNSPKQRRMNCPACDQVCLPVSMQTMRHQVQAPDNRHIVDGDYAFCANRDCSVGYFSASATIPKAILRAFQPAQPAMLCHCFDISEAAYRAALAGGTAAAMKAFVVQQTQAKQCACEARNPAGRCCLAAFKQMEKAL